MKKLTILLVISQTLSIISTTEKIPNLNRDAFKRMTDNEKYYLISKLISEYNNIIQYYNESNENYENQLLEKNKEIERIKKSIKYNQFRIEIGYGISTKLENNILFQLSYSRILLSFFGIGSSIAYNYNNNHTIYLSIHTIILF